MSFAFSFTDSFATVNENNVTSSTPSPATTPSIYTLDILMGASVQGNPSFDPSTLTAFENGTIEILNLDNVPHDIVNGKGPRDNESGKLFDTGIIDAGDLAYLNMSNLHLSTGDYIYYCSIHPYMKGQITILNETNRASEYTQVRQPQLPQQHQQEEPATPPRTSTFSNQPQAELQSQSQTPAYQSPSPQQQQLFAPPQSFMPPSQGAETGLIILSQTSYVDSIGMTHIVGEVQNILYEPANFVKVTASFYNRFNQIIGTQSGYTDPNDLYPGQRAPFTILISKGSMPSYDITYYTLNVDSS